MEGAVGAGVVDAGVGVAVRDHDFPGRSSGQPAGDGSFDGELDTFASRGRCEG